ncbi:MAG: GNAT family N-acetyltransferase [Actinomycetota bacterium]|nr:GNAT family N-acetyltransferase [Actinomycetota bacterium]
MTQTISPTVTSTREITPADTETVARILFQAFAGIHDRHCFPRDFPTFEAGVDLVSHFTAHPSIWGVVAERDGEIVGSNFLDERGPVAGVGPITVDTRAQGAGVGRQLMHVVLGRAEGRDDVRLLQDSFNVQSLALYTSLGFRAEEPVALMSGRPSAAPPADVEVRPLTPEDVPACERLSLAVHGFERTAELRDSLQAPGLEPFVAVRAGRVVGYATTVSVFPAAYAVAETEAVMAALVAGAVTATGEPASILVPVRQHQLFRWALEAGLRVVKPMTYMSTGGYRRPRGAWIPSVLY